MKDGFIKTAAATIDVKVADCSHNENEIINIIGKCAAEGVKLLVFPELCITGYTCGDLFLQGTLLEAAEKSLLNIVKKTENTEMITVVGCPIKREGRLYNCAVVILGGSILGIVPKNNIPDYGEYSERRHFTEAPENNTEVELGGEKYPFGAKMIFKCRQMPEMCIAAEICEDLWVPDSPSIAHSQAGATVIVNLSASNEIATKSEYRRNLVKLQSAKLLCAYIYADAGEGESTTDLVFAGHNIIAENGSILAESNLFENTIIISEIDVLKLDGERRRMSDFGKTEPEGYTCIDFSMEKTETDILRDISKTPFIPDDLNECNIRCKSILQMQTSGLKKRILHSAAKKAVIGISGGLDSCLALLVSAEAMDRLGRDRGDIIAITMPCFGTTTRTKSNAVKLCEELGINCRTIDITESVTKHLDEIGHDIKNTNVVYENAQARQRTLVLMDIANETGGIVIGTGDLSELALGWATYNGDHMSMYGVNSGVPKTLVRYLVKYYADTAENSELKKVLYDILDTPVSPELLPAEGDSITQKTEDIVGPYELHDFYLYYTVRWAFSPEKIFRIAKHAFLGIYDDKTLIKWLEIFFRRFFMQQFKRSCLPDGPKVGTVGLSPRGDWHMPSDASSAVWMAEIEELKK